MGSLFMFMLKSLILQSPYLPHRHFYLAYFYHSCFEVG